MTTKNLHGYEDNVKLIFIFMNEKNRSIMESHITHKVFMCMAASSNIVIWWHQ